MIEYVGALEKHYVYGLRTEKRAPVQHQIERFISFVGGFFFKGAPLKRSQQSILGRIKKGVKPTSVVKCPIRLITKHFNLLNSETGNLDVRSPANTLFSCEANLHRANKIAWTCQTDM